MSMTSHGTPSSQEIGGNGAHFNSHSHSGPPRSVKRPRPVKSCIECRTRKLRCDRLLPCSQCQKSQRTCRYAADGVVNDGDSSAAANFQSDGSDVEAAHDNRASKRNCATVSLPSSTNIEPAVPPSRSRSERSVNVTNPSADDYGARLDRLERILLAKSSSSPSMSSREYHPRTRPLASASTTIRGLTVKGVTRTRYFGQNSTRVLINLFDEAKDLMFNRQKPGDLRETFASIQRIHNALHDEHRRAETPIAVFVDSMTPIQKRMSDILPKKQVCDQLLQIYLSGSEGALYRTMHIPTFQNHYDGYWDGTYRSDCFLPQLLSILCIGYRFIGLGKGLHHDRDGIHLPTACTLVREWLDGQKGKQLVDFGTIQVETLLLMAQRMINPRFQESWTRLGYIVRMAMTMGLHRDPSEFPTKITPYWAELRRRLWYTIMEIDLQMSMQCNMPAGVRESDYTTKPPQNLNDEELHPSLQELPDGRPIDHPTDSQIQVYSASTLACRFRAVDLISRVDSLTDYQEVLDCGNQLERAFEDMRFIVPRAPPGNPNEVNRSWRVRTILDMTIRRTLLALYRPFALSTPDVPHHILTSYLRSSVVLLSYPDDLDPNSPTYLHIWHMHYLILKQDILQAAFSVCYYIKHAAARNDCPSPASSHVTRSSKSESIEEACIIASESSALLSLPRLVKSVENALEAMIRRIREIGTDMKDLISLTVVLSTCQGGSWDQKQERVNQGMRAIVEAGMHSMRSTNAETLVSLRIIPGPPSATLSTPSLPSPAGPPPGFISPGHAPFNMGMLAQEMPSMMPGPVPDDSGRWDVEFWNPLLHGGGQ